MPKPLLFLLKLSGICLGLFAVLFTIYFFNIDMKLTSKIEPFLLKHYDEMEREVRI